jgi:hypothetical protein
MNNLKTKITIVSLLIGMLFGIRSSGIAQAIAINEVMASNATTLADDDNDYEDWIEVYNYGEAPVTIAGYGLSDSYNNPFKWIFPDVTIMPGEYLLIWASGKDRRVPGYPLHTNFSISAGGEEIILTHPNGNTIDELEPTPLPTDISIGRTPNGQGNWRYFTQATPGAPNIWDGYGNLLGPVIFSQQGGAFTDEFSLALGHDLEAQIFYTTDGSVPTETSFTYVEPITIRNRTGDPNDISEIPSNFLDIGPPYYEGWQPPNGNVFKVNVVRARAMHPDAPPGPVTTHTYLVHPSSNERYSLPWLSLTTDRANLFDPEIGIYVPGNNNNYFQDGDEWERPANLQMFEMDGSMAFNQDIGVRLHGNTTRSRPRKSLRINARNEYGESWINYQLFPDKEINQYKRFILRNSGNDWDQSVLRDGFMQALMKNLHVETQYYRPSVLFINGEYWGIHNIRDRYNHHYILSHYGIDEHEMTILENNAVFKFGNPAGTSHYVNMRSFIASNSLSSQSNFNYVQTLMDVESFTDFQLSNIYVMNTDWPGNNSLMWRYLRDGFEAGAGVMDGRWRWFILDTDFGFGLDYFYVPGVDQGAAHNTLAMALAQNGPSWPNPPWSTFLLRNLLNNQGYKHYFINRFVDLLNTTFSVNYVTHMLDSLAGLIEPEMQEHIDRWRRPVNMNQWLQRIQVMRNFAQQRTAYMRNHIQSQFSLAGTIGVQLNIEPAGAGSIQINTIKPEFSAIWEGTYFMNIPITVKAIEASGYRFIGWTGSVNSQLYQIELSPANHVQLTANFEISDDFPGDDMNPPAYRLAQGAYQFDYWGPNNPEGSFPPNMIFQQSNINDPDLADEMTHPYSIPLNEYHGNDAGSIGFPYRLTRRTRLNGLGENGISFINTGRGRDLGAAVLAVDTRGLDNITVSWTAATLQANSRAYAIRLQYRLGYEGTFIDVTDSVGNLVEYYRNTLTGHETTFKRIRLPAELNNVAYVQLRWKYYFTGQQLDPESGQRDELRLDDIKVSTLTMDLPEQNANPAVRLMLDQNYPNPFNGITTINYQLFEGGYVQLVVFNHFGQKIASLTNQQQPQGHYTYYFDSSGLPSGMYYYKLSLDGYHVSRKMQIMK